MNVVPVMEDHRARQPARPAAPFLAPLPEARGAGVVVGRDGELDVVHPEVFPPQVEGPEVVPGVGAVRILEGLEAHGHGQRGAALHDLADVHALDLEGLVIVVGSDHGLEGEAVVPESGRRHPQHVVDVADLLLLDRMADQVKAVAQDSPLVPVGASLHPHAKVVVLFLDLKDEFVDGLGIAVRELHRERLRTTRFPGAVVNRNRPLDDLASRIRGVDEGRDLAPGPVEEAQLATFLESSHRLPRERNRVGLARRDGAFDQRAAVKVARRAPFDLGRRRSGRRKHHQRQECETCNLAMHAGVPPGLVAGGWRSASSRRGWRRRPAARTPGRAGSAPRGRTGRP